MELYFQSDVGRKRNTNQDYAAFYQNRKQYTLAILADGMGGHQAGDIASKQTVTALGEAWEQTQIADCEQAEAWLVEQIQTINHDVYALGESEEKLNGMGTTLVAVALFETAFTLAHVGDSRVYALSQQTMTQLTEDHSLVNALVKSGEITPEMAATHPRRNVLTRSIGMPGDVEIDISSKTFTDEAYLLLCSDGLTNMLSDDDIASFIQPDVSVQTMTQQLIAAANEQGGVDNITVLLIRLGGDVHE